jgi:hypothetical protein
MAKRKKRSTVKKKKRAEDNARRGSKSGRGKTTKRSVARPKGRRTAVKKSARKEIRETMVLPGTPVVHKPPIFSQAEAQRYVFRAFAGLGKTDVKVTDLLAKLQMSGPTQLLALALAINNVLPRTVKGISDDVALSWGGKKVSDVVTSVEYVPVS